MPCAADNFARFVTGLGVFNPLVNRFAFVRELLCAIVARRDRPSTLSLAVGTDHQRRPVGCALAVAHALAALGSVFVEGVKRHAFDTDQGATSLRRGAAIAAPGANSRSEK